MSTDSDADRDMLRDSLGRLLAEHYDFAARRRILASPQGWSTAVWARHAELGLTAIGLPAAQGGIGGAAEMLVVMQEFGRVLALEPLLASTILGGTALARAGTPAQCAALLPRVAEGSLRLALAHGEAAARHDPAWVETAARPSAAGWRLHGRKHAVLHGDSAQLLLVSARIAGAAGDTDGIGLFLVAPDSPGLRRRGFCLQDGTRIADIELSEVPAELLAADAWSAIEAAQQAGLAALLAACVGAIDAALALTVAYLKTRQQFGRPIGANQALQHRAADMLVAAEEARSMAMLATASLAEADAARRAADLSRARVVVARSARFIGQQAVQLHGGIGMTEEYAVGHYLRFLTVAAQLFGDAEWHLARLAAALDI
jgi:alkylation response protein AidB-like acyl-CoA dehydrogenase